MSVFRIHGDNIVECERIARLIQEELNPHTFSTSLISPSTINIEMNFTYLGIAIVFIPQTATGYGGEYGVGSWVEWIYTYTADIH